MEAQIWSCPLGLPTSSITTTLKLATPVTELSARYWRSDAKVWDEVHSVVPENWRAIFGRNWSALEDIMSDWCHDGRLFIIRDISAHHRDNVNRFVAIVAGVFREDPILQPREPVAVVLEHWGYSQLVVRWRSGTRKQYAVQELPVS